MHHFRTHTCNELGKKQIGQTVRLSGWIHNRRDHGGVLFIDLRDHYGLTQIVIHPDVPFLKEAAHLHKETVVLFEGEVAPRSDENVNPKLTTGEVEVAVRSYRILGTCDPLPFSIFPEEPLPEDTRLKYRYLDLRRSKIHSNIVLRSRVISSIRRRMTELGFMEIQTPVLTSSSPEGARDFLVPSRLHPGCFYALPQAPQQYKQLLMMAGFDRYFQIAPCFRDEDARANRSPGEFYQLDIEMSFVTQEDIFKVVETVFHGLFQEFSDWKVTEPPFPRIPYREAMLKYGTDKPDLRIPIEIGDVSDIFAASSFNAFRQAVERGQVVRAVPVKEIAGKPRSFFDRLVEYARSLGSHGLAYLAWTGDQVKGPLAKHLTESQLHDIAGRFDIHPGDVIFLLCNNLKEAELLSSAIRLKLAKELDLFEKGTYRFCWITDYPMFEWNEEQQAIAFSHNPFSMPQGGLEALEKKDPLQVLAYQYDIVCNGVELSSGAVRNHSPEIMYKAFEIGGYTKEEVDEDFSGMISAFHFGAPPHGGIAPGVDRIIMLLADEPNIREIIAFPMNGQAQDLMMNAPRPVTEKQLSELSIRIVPKRKT